MHLRLEFLHHVDVVRDTFVFFVKSHHLTLDGDGVNFMDTAANFAEVCEEIRGRHLGVKVCGFLKLFEPYIIHGVLYEGGTAFAGGVVEGAVISLGSVFRYDVLYCRLVCVCRNGFFG